MNRTRSDDSRPRAARLGKDGALPSPMARALAAAATVGALLGLGAQDPSALGALGAGACPTAFASVAAGSAEERLADGNGDGLACRLVTIDRRDGARLIALTDNEAVGMIIYGAPAACPAPLRGVHVEDPDDFPAELRPHTAAVDPNGDGLTCARATETPSQRVLVVLDNVRAAASPQITTVPRVTATAR